MVLQKAVLKCFPFFLLVSLFVYACGGSAIKSPAKWDKETGAILATAELFFASMEQKNYPEIWENLSRESKNRIIIDIYDKCRQLPQSSCAKAVITSDFNEGGIIAKTYWDNFLANFNPSLVTEQSVWSMGKIGAQEAEIVITYRGASRSAILRMFKEDGEWKVGFEESFRPLRLILKG